MPRGFILWLAFLRGALAVILTGLGLYFGGINPSGPGAGQTIVTTGLFITLSAGGAVFALILWSCLDFWDGR